jgi:hypothetical protein
MEVIMYDEKLTTIYTILKQTTQAQLKQIEIIKEDDSIVVYSINDDGDHRRCMHSPELSEISRLITSSVYAAADENGCVYLIFC